MHSLLWFSDIAAYFSITVVKCKNFNTLFPKSILVWIHVIHINLLSHNTRAHWNHINQFCITNTCFLSSTSQLHDVAIQNTAAIWSETLCFVYTNFGIIHCSHSFGSSSNTVINHSVDDACSSFGMDHKNNIYPDNKKWKERTMLCLEYDTRQNEITTNLLNDITDYFNILLVHFFTLVRIYWT